MEKLLTAKIITPALLLGLSLSILLISPLVFDFSVSASINTGLISHWEMDESANDSCAGGQDICDSSGNGNHAINQGSPSIVPGVIGNARDFNGSGDAAYIPFNSDFNLGTTFSLATWINHDSRPGGNPDYIDAIFSKYFDASVGSYNWRINPGGTNGFIWRQTSGGGGQRSIFTSQQLPLNDWTHLAVSYDGANLRYYVNGVLVNTEAQTATPPNVSSTVFIGRHDSGSPYQYYLDGTLDDFRVYERTISDAEVAQLYQLGEDSLDASLQGFWRLNNNLLDSSGNNNTATINGNAFFGDGYFGSGSIELDGASDYIDFSNYSLSSEFTLSAWYNIDALTSHNTIWDYGPDNNNKIQIASNKTLFIRINNSTVTGLNLDSFNLDEWFMLTITRDENNLIRIYKNGVQTDSYTQAGTFLVDRVGDDSDFGNDIDGNIDEVRIYDRALSASMVNELYEEVDVDIYASCPSSVQARFQVGSTGLHQNGTFAISTLDAGANFQWSAVMNGDVNQIFGGEVTLTEPNSSTTILSSANGVDVPEPFQTGTYSIEARALNGSLCDSASITVVPDPGAGDVLCDDLDVTTVDDDTNVCDVTNTGTEDVYVRDPSNGYIVGRLTVDLDSGRDWGQMSVLSRDKAEFGGGNAAVLHYPGGASSIPGIVGSSFTLYVPRDTDDVKVDICPGAADSSKVTYTCANGVSLPLGTTGQYTVSAVTLESKDYFEIAGVTGTGGITIPNGISDTLTRLEVSANSDHAVRYATVNGLTASGDTTAVQFDSAGQNWDLSSITISDIDLEDDGVDKTLAASAAADTWGVTINTTTDTITFTAPTSGTDYIAAGSTIVIKVGTNADSGTNQMVNPATVNTYEVDIVNTYSGGVETAEVEIPIIDDDTVNVSGYIDTFITFDIDTSDTDEDCDAAGGALPCDSHGGSSDNAGYVVDLGELTTASVNDSGDSVTHSDGLSGIINSIFFDLSSNADGGVSVVVQSLNGFLQGPLSNSIPSVAQGSEVQITPGSGLYGLVSHAGNVNSSISGGVLINDECDGDGGVDYFCGVTTSTTEIFNTAGSPVDEQRLEFEVGASPDSLDGTGVYTDQLTFIATPTF